MNSFIKKAFSLLLIGCFLVLGLGVVRVNAADETVIFSEKGYTNQQVISTCEGTDFSIAFNKGTNSNDCKYFTTGSAIRVYGGGYFIVSSDTKTISQIQLSFASGENNNEITTEVGTYNDGTWEGSSESVKFTVGGTSGHRRLASVAVTFETSGDTPDPDPVAVTGVTIDKTELSLYKGDTETLIATVSPANATNKNVTWSSSDEDVATVSPTGLVTGVSAGNATITVTTVDGSKTADCDVTVTEYVPVLTVGKYYALQDVNGENELTGISSTSTKYGMQRSTSGVSIAAFPLLIKEGNKANTFSFKNGENYLYWTSGNSLNVNTEINDNSSWNVTEENEIFSIVNVADNNRKIVYNSGSPRFACYTSAQTAVKLVLLYSVTFNSNGGSSVDSINYIYSNKSIDKPTDPTKNDYVFSGWYKDSELQDEWNFNTDTVTEDITLYAKWESAAQAIHVESVSLNKSSTSIEVGETETLIATISPDNAANKNVTWSSSDESVATVSNGVVTGVKAGTTSITVTSADNNEITDTCLVTVTAIPKYIVSVEGGKFDNDETIDEFERGDTVSVSPVENSYEIFTFWSDADSNVLSYDKYYTFTVNSDLEIFANFKSKDMFIDLTNSEGSINGGTLLENLNSFSNCEYLISISCVYAYRNANYGIKFGKGEGKGSITITLKDGFTATGIRIKAKTYGTDSTTLFVNSNDETKQTLTTTTNIYEYSFNATNKIIISPNSSSSQRFYVYTIEIIGINTYSSVKIQGSVGLDANSQGAFRLLGVAGADAYDSYGVAYKNSTGTWHEYTELDVYDSVYAYDGEDKVSYTAAELGGSVIFGVEVIGLPKDKVYTVSIKSFVEIDSVKYYSAERTFTITVNDSGVNIEEA